MDKEITEFFNKISGYLELIDEEALRLARNDDVNSITWLQDQDSELNHKLTKQFFGTIMRSRDALQDILRMIDDVTCEQKHLYLNALKNHNY